MLKFFRLLSGALSTAAYIPYIRDTYLGHTRPAPASLLIWSVLGSITFLGQIYEGTSTSLWLGHGLRIYRKNGNNTCLCSIRPDLVVFGPYSSIFFGNHHRDQFARRLGYRCKSRL